MSIPVHPPYDPEAIREEVEKARSLVETALRLLEGGNMVDLSALDGRIAVICDALEGMSKTVARPLVPLLNALMDTMGQVENVLRQRLSLDEPPPED